MHICANMKVSGKLAFERVSFPQLMVETSNLSEEATEAQWLASANHLERKRSMEAQLLGGNCGGLTDKRPLWT